MRRIPAEIIARWEAATITRKGHCIVCGEPLPKGRRRYCTDLHARWGKWLEREALTCQLPECGARLAPGRRRYCTDEHAKAGYYAARRIARKADGGGEMIQAAARLLAKAAANAHHIDATTLGILWKMQTDLEDAVITAIDGLREQGYTWDELAAELGTTRQAVSQWRKRRPAKTPLAIER